MDHIYLIEEIWIDSFENQVDSAVGYTPLGWVSTEEEAINFCKGGRMYDKKDCWAIGYPLPEFIFRKLTKLKVDEHIQVVQEKEEGSKD